MHEFRPHSSEVLDRLSALASDHTSDLIRRVLREAREHLGMEVSFISRIEDGWQEYSFMGGDPTSFGVSDGDGIPLDSSYCQMLVAGEPSLIIQNARHDPRTSGMAVTHAAEVGSYIGVPLRFSDGRIYGTLCCISHEESSSLSERDTQFLKVLARLVSEHLEIAQLQAGRHQAEVQMASVAALIAALDAHDGYTGEHSKAVVELSKAVAHRMKLSEERLADVEQVALLHDIGKMGIPDAILQKPGPLDEDEWEVMRQHPVVGVEIVARTGSLARLAPAVRAEHERWDGSGYPDGLAGEQIPLESRIVFACDAFHAMTSDRPYRSAMSIEDARLELAAGSGSQFCPTVAARLLEELEKRLKAQ